MLLTDPPYNVAYEGVAGTIKNDNMADETYRAFLFDAFSCAASALTPGGAFYVWHASRYHRETADALEACDMTVRQQLIWNKNAMVMGRQDYQWKHEPCLYGWRGGASHRWCSDRKQTTVLDFDKPQRSDDHPTMKPVALFAYLIQNSTKSGDTVLDVFGGSGTTIVAAEKTGRRARVMELDEEYASKAVARWERLTGIKAEKIA